jgi:hypothetical protein
MQPAPRFRNGKRERDEPIEPPLVSLLNCPFGRGEDDPAGGIFESGLAEGPRRLSSDRKPVEVRFQPAIKPIEVLHREIRAFGAGSPQLPQERGLLGMLLNNRRYNCRATHCAQLRSDAVHTFSGHWWRVHF